MLSFISWSLILIYIIVVKSSAPIAIRRRHPIKKRPPPRSIVFSMVRAAGVRSPTASHQRRKNGRVALLSLALGINELGIRLGGSESVWVIPFCSPVVELNRCFDTQKLSRVDRSAHTRQVHIKSPHLHLHTPPNPTCSRWYDHEWLKADYKPDSTPPPPLCCLFVPMMETPEWYGD